MTRRGIPRAFVGILATLALAVGAPPSIAPTAYQTLRYRFIGPPGNRTDAVVGIPGDPAIYYAGAASGGIWKTVDGGVHWKPIFDDQLVSSIGALALAPSDPDIVWAGTGESFTRSLPHWQNSSLTNFRPESILKPSFRKVVHRLPSDRAFCTFRTRKRAS